MTPAPNWRRSDSALNVYFRAIARILDDAEIELAPLDRDALLSTLATNIAWRHRDEARVA